MKIPYFMPPNFDSPKRSGAEDINFAKVEEDGVAPEGFFLTTHFPTYYKVDGHWMIPDHSSLNCVAVKSDLGVEIVELRNLKLGDEVALGRTTDGSEGILVYKAGFDSMVYGDYGHAVETSFSDDYAFLFELMKSVREEDGKIAWVMGPSVVFDYDTRVALTHLAKEGYVGCLLGGNAIATHDLEGGYLGTALGQNIYTQENVPLGHYNHLDLLNEVRSFGSIDSFIASGNVENGFIKTLIELKIPFILSGSIRDDGPLPEVFADVSKALDATREQLNSASLIICLATMLHGVSVANLASSYRINSHGAIAPVYMFTIDVTENVARKVAAAREMIAVRSIITNVQDFVVNCEKALLQEGMR